MPGAARRHGSAPGERRGGRKAGVPNKATADIKALARPYGAPAIAELARLGGLTKAPGAPNAAVRVAALRELLDRGYGRATTILAGDSEAPPAVIRFEWASAAPSAAADAAATAATAIDAEARPLSLIWENNC
jgi:hypothetical protein